MGYTPECLLYGFSITATAHKPQLYQDTTSEVRYICIFGDFLKTAIFFPSLCPGLLILFSWSGTNFPNFHFPDPRGFPICLSGERAVETSRTVVGAQQRNVHVLVEGHQL